MSKLMSKIKPVGKPKVILKENFAENYKKNIPENQNYT